MDIAKDIRALLRTVANDIAEIEGAVVGHVHFIAAMSHIAGSVRQEFDRIVAGGLFAGEPDDAAKIVDDDPTQAEDPALGGDPVAAVTDDPIPEASATPAPAAEAVTEPSA